MKLIYFFIPKLSINNNIPGIIAGGLCRSSINFSILLLILIFIFSFLISSYHFGIEQGFIEESLICDLKSGSDILTKEELLLELQKKQISCKDVTFRIFGLSLTTINILISLILVILLTKIFVTYEKIK